ncbi:MAG: N-acetylmuramoyl-L-alanine amidase [Deltaproteobacteria bacterium]|nr:N-acetylmuramoyl-L-alanine amidase [Deltaproteobacteria bacterium]
MEGAFKYIAAAAVLTLFFAPRGFGADGIAPQRVIVLDPGHGGDDAGAVGPDGVREKDITLAVAKELEAELSKSPGTRIILTRTDDTFIPLGERTNIANRARADIFVSIHANSAYKRDASGVETYFLSFEASDSDSRKLAAIENNVISAGPEDKGGNDIESIIWDLVETETLKESEELAGSVHDRLVKATNGENRGVKQAPFFVLAGATMPAVLVEVGFISNPEEEKKLSSEGAQKTIAAAISSGVADFEKKLGKREGLLKTGRYDKE